MESNIWIYISIQERRSQLTPAPAVSVKIERL